MPTPNGYGMRLRLFCLCRFVFAPFRRVDGFRLINYHLQSQTALNGQIWSSCAFLLALCAVFVIAYELLQAVSSDNGTQRPPKAQKGIEHPRKRTTKRRKEPPKITALCCQCSNVGSLLTESNRQITPNGCRQKSIKAQIDHIKKGGR